MLTRSEFRHPDFEGKHMTKRHNRYDCLTCIVAIITAITLCAVEAASSETATSNPILVFGHKNPDTDAVLSAIGAAHFLNKTGRPAIACVQGEITPQTAYVLETFNISPPENIPPVAGRQIGLVDFNEYSQGPDDMKKAELVFLVDHHRLGDVTSSAPLEARLQPLGSTCTVLYEMFTENDIPIPQDIAGGLLSAILSDTVCFRSVTTTERDRIAATELARIAGVEDTGTLGEELFAVRDAPPRTLLRRDYKSFMMGGRKIGVSQIEVVDMGQLDGRKSALRAEMDILKRESGSFAILLMLTDITRNGTELLVESDAPGVIAEAFSTTMKDGSMWLDGVMSRKKQIVPPLEKTFEQLVEETADEIGVGVHE